MKALVTIDQATRRRLIKCLWALGEHYYLFSDGTSYEVEQRHQHSIEHWTKTQLVDTLYALLLGVYERSGGVNRVALVDYTSTLVRCGLIMPYHHELPTPQARNLLDLPVEWTRFWAR